MSYSFSRLSVEQMVAISGDWLTNQQAVLQGIPYTSCYLDDLGQVHRALLRHLQRADELPPEVQALIERARGLDVRHDRLYRGTNRTIEGQAYFAETAAEEAELTQLQEHYFPRGDSGTQLTHQEESGAALILAEKLKSDQPPNPAYKARLQAIPVADGVTLYDKVLSLIGVALELGEVDKAKSGALKAHEEAAKSGASQTAREVQFEWIGIARRIVDGVEHAAKKGLLTPEARQALFGPLDRAYEVALRRSAARRGQAEPSPEAPSDEGDAPPDPTVKGS